MKRHTRQLVRLLAAGPLVFHGCDRLDMVLDPDAAPPSLAAAAHRRALPFRSTYPCTGSGEMKLHGVVTNQTDAGGTGRMAIHAVATPQNCRWVNDHGAFEVQGSPNLTIHGSREVVQNVLGSDFIGTMRGKVNWTRDGRASLCHFEVTFRAVLSPTLLVSFEGTECGKHVLREVFLLE